MVLPLFLLFHQNEQYLHLSGSLLKNNTGEKTGIIVALHDVTRLHQLETIRRDFVANVSPH